MNRYRTTPGLGPYKATTTTTCQKCLKKGHYSYECKESLQSRPYVGRASRTEQLRNPKLKPALTEAKLADPVTEATSTSTSVEQEEQVGSQRRQGRPSSMSPEHTAKRRRRSVSSSSSSVATISTEASVSDREAAPKTRRSPRHQPESREPRARVPRLSERDRRALSSSRSASPPRDRKRPSRGHQRSRRAPSNDVSNDDNPRSRKNPSLDRRSRSPRRQADPPRPETLPSKSYRERSLSPYSRRLALTHAMNDGQPSRT